MNARVLAGMGVTVMAVAAPLAAQRADTVVKIAGAPVHAGVATMVRELAIGESDARPEAAFGDIADIAVGRDGAIYVMDRSVPALRVFDARGAFVRTIGGKGQGPGEYSSVAGVNLLPDGRVILWDLVTWRVNVYSASGAVLDHWPTGGSGTANVSGRDFVTVDSAGTIYLMKSIVERRMQTVTRDGRTLRVPAPDFGAARTVWLRMRPGGAVLDPIEGPAGRDVPYAYLRASIAGGAASVSAPLPFQPSYTALRSAAGQFISGYGAEYAFNVAVPGRPVLTVRRNIPVRAVTPAERDTARRIITSQLREIDPAWAWSGPEIPRTKPAFTNLRGANDGRIWVTVDAPATESVAASVGFSCGGRGCDAMVSSGRGDGTQVPIRRRFSRGCGTQPATVRDVFEPDGTYVGQVRVPTRLEIIVSRGDLVWGTTCDDDDVPTVVRYRIVWP